MDCYAHIIEQLPHVRRIGRFWRARCPVHGSDKQLSFTAWIGTDGRLMARCFACQATFPEIVRALGTKMSDWFPPQPEKEERRPKVPDRILAQYPFHDADGTLLCEEVRLTPFPNQDKRIRYRRPMADGSWAWSLQEGVYRKRVDGWKLAEGVVELREGDELLEAVPRVPYRLPDLLKSAYAIIVEGCKDADSLRRIGLTATTAPCGSRNWRVEFGKYFCGKRVAVMPDLDAAGEVYAQMVVGSLVLCGAASIRVVPSLTAKDISDLLADRTWQALSVPRRRNAVLDMIRPVPAWEPSDGPEPVRKIVPFPLRR